MFLRHRFDFVKSEPLRTQMRECINVLEYWDKEEKVSVSTSAAVKAAFDAMRVFFQDQFFSGEGDEGENFQTKFESMVSYVQAIDPAGIERMQRELENRSPHCK